MEIIAGEKSSIRPELMASLARYRYRVFVGRLGWKLQCEHDMEFDQFDRTDTLYVIAQNEAKDIIGSARLLPTIRPYLLAEVFPELLNGLPAPASPDVWELSRFAAVDFGSNSGAPLGQYSSPIAADLLRATFRIAAKQGARKLVTVSPLAVERLLRKEGFRAHRLGPPITIGGGLIFASEIEIPAVRTK